MTSTGDLDARRSGKLGGLVRSLRPSQWSKNSVVFAALIFSRAFLDLDQVLRSVHAFLLFCAASSAVYLLNDVLDAQSDRRHPVKSTRPIAAGVVPAGLALATSALLGAVAVGGAYVLAPPFCWALAGYLTLNLAYSIWLKKVVILDVMIVAAGFLLRAVGGGVAIRVEVSQWLILCASLLSLFLIFCKRRNELAVLAETAGEHREILREYSFPFLDQMIGVVTASTLLAYCLYTMDPEVQEKLGTTTLPLTIPFVLYGIFRYLYLVYRRQEGGSPTRTFYADPPLLVNVGLWTLTVLWALGPGRG